MILNDEQKGGLIKNVKSSVENLKKDIQKQLIEYKLRSLYTLFSNDLSNILEEQLRALIQAFVLKEKDKKLLSLLIINETQDAIEASIDTINLNDLDAIIDIYINAIQKAFIIFEKIGDRNVY